MSYGPMLLIDKEDLDNKQIEIFARKVNNITITSEDKVKAFNELEKALTLDIVEFKNKKMIIIHPELTTHNKNVRRLLDELKIYYVTYY